MCREIPLPELPHIERYYHYSRVFSPPECAELIRIAESHGMEQGSIGVGMGQTPKVELAYRAVHTARVFEHEAPWAFQRLIKHTLMVNQAWGFNLNGLFEDIGIMRYVPPHSDRPPGHYNWHQDFGGGKYSQRKISIVSLLVPPSDFEGGQLKIHADRGEEVTSLNEQGDMVMFPSWTPHCVTDVTAGVRYTLVAWVSGPRFR